MTATDPSNPTERVLSALAEHGANPRRSGNGWSARCPAHEDRSPSLSVTESETGNALVHCHAGCTTADVARAIGLSLVDLFPPRPPKVAHIGPAGRVKATYNYYDADGALAYRVVRYEPKTFRQQRYEEGRWLNGRGTVPRVLYNLPQLLAAKRAGRPIWVVEGEKDAENAQWLADGVVATTAPEGAGKWEDSFTDALAGAPEVVVVADKDAPGYRHAQGIAQALRDRVGRLTVVEAAAGKDLTDHVNAGFGIDDFVVLWNSNAPTSWLEDAEAPAEPAALVSAVFIDWASFWARDDTAEEWLAEPLIPAGRGIAIYAPAKAGKSLLVLDVAASLASGKPCLGLPAREPVHVMYLDYEMTQEDLYDRLSDMGYGPEVDLSHLHYASLPALPPLDTAEGANAVIELAEQCQARLVVVDTLSRVISQEENDSQALLDLYRLLGVPLKGKGVSLLRLDHAGKNLEKGARGSSAKNDDVDVVWQLTKAEDGVRMKCTHKRVPWVADLVALRQEKDPILRHVVDKDAAPWPAGTKEVAKALDDLGLPLDVSRRTAGKALKEAGQGRANDLVAAAIRWRKAEVPLFLEGPQSGPGGSQDHFSEGSQDRSPGPLDEMPSEQARTTPRTTQDHLPEHMGQCGPISDRTTGPATPPPDDDDEELSLL